MPPDPFIQSHLLRRHGEIAAEFEAVVEVRRYLPEQAWRVAATNNRDRLLARVLVPDGPHPCAARTRLAPEKLRGRKRAAVVQQADQERAGRVLAVRPAFANRLPDELPLERRLDRKRQLDPRDIMIPDTECAGIEHRVG